MNCWDCGHPTEAHPGEPPSHRLADIEGSCSVEGCDCRRFFQTYALEAQARRADDEWLTAALSPTEDKP